MGKPAIKLKQGETYYKLTAITLLSIGKYGGEIWLFKCYCGKEVIRKPCPVIRGHAKSCGCYVNGEIRKSDNTAFKEVYNTYKYNSRVREIDFNLTHEEFKEITSKNCHYCGTIPKQILNSRNKKHIFIYNGIDRIDSNKDYNLDNCYPCCKTCNWMKNDLGYDEFLIHIKTIVKNLSQYGRQ